MVITGDTRSLDYSSHELITAIPVIKGTITSGDKDPFGRIV